VNTYPAVLLDVTGDEHRLKLPPRRQRSSGRRLPAIYTGPHGLDFTPAEPFVSALEDRGELTVPMMLRWSLAAA
jgi:hypothetical protein